MIGRSKRRFYRFGVAAGILFLSATLLYDAAEVGANSLLFVALPGILEFLGCVCSFTAFEALAYPDDYDRFEEVFPSRRYGIIYYAVASLMALATVFLLAWILASRRPNTQEQLVIMWGLFVIGGCVILGAKSRYEVG